MTAATSLTGRLLLASLFILSGIGKLGAGYAGTQGYMEAMGVPGALLPLVILAELGGGLLLVLGWQTRWAAYGLAGFTLVTGVIFHHNLGDQIQMIMFMKNLSIAGGLLLLGLHGAGAWSVDHRSGRAVPGVRAMSV
jgi:putative oxidoreductase